MFTHIVLLKRDPWFLYADNETEALKTALKFKDDCSGIVSGKNIIVKHPTLKMTLDQDETRLLEAPTVSQLINPTPEVVKDFNEEIISSEEMTELEKELDDELDKFEPQP